MSALASLLTTGKHLYALILGVFGIGFLIAIHETGHFLFCKLFNVSTPSFSIGFGPRLIEKKIGETVFTLSLIPMGGYVEIAGTEESAKKDKKSFAGKPYYQKMLIMAGGIIVNILFSYLIFSLLFATGIPKTPLFSQTITTQVESIQKNSAAEKAGLKSGDIITAINTTSITSGLQLFKLLQKNNDRAITIDVERNDKRETITITPENNKFGIQPALRSIPPKSLLNSLKEGFSTTNKLLKNTLGFFGTLFNKKTLNQVGGPLMLITQAVKSAHQGIKIYLLLLAIISVNLAVLNIIPLPILDGGQMLIYTIEAIIRKPFPEIVRLYMAYATWIGVLGLTLYFTYKDIIRIIQSIFS